MEWWLHFRKVYGAIPIMRSSIANTSGVLWLQLPENTGPIDFSRGWFFFFFLNHAFQWSTWNTSTAGYTTRSHTLVLLHYLCETSLWDIFMRLPASVAVSDLVGMLWILKPNQFFLLFFFANTLNSIARHKGPAKTSVFENKARRLSETEVALNETV